MTDSLAPPGDPEDRAGGPQSWAYVALGANLGEPAAQLRKAADRLAGLGRVMARSSIYATAPVGGPAGQADYLNAVIAIDVRGWPRASAVAQIPAVPEVTGVPVRGPHDLLRQLLAIEVEMGRVRHERWGPRLIDLDLLAYGSTVVTGGPEVPGSGGGHASAERAAGQRGQGKAELPALPALILPHPRLAERAFVLVPLCEIASRRNDAQRGWVHPGTGRDACGMLGALVAAEDPAAVTVGGGRADRAAVGLGVRPTDLRW